MTRIAYLSFSDYKYPKGLDEKDKPLYDIFVNAERNMGQTYLNKDK